LNTRFNYTTYIAALKDILRFNKFTLQTLRLKNIMNSYLPDNKSLQKITSNMFSIGLNFQIKKFIKDNT